MTLKEAYPRRKQALLVDEKVCPANRKLFKKFFEFEEYKLQRQNQLPQLDEGCCKTLCVYVIRFRNVNTWFNNKPWVKLTRADIQRVYDGLESGAIRNANGKPFKDVRSYYNKVFKAKPFALAGKAVLAREVLEFFKDHQTPEVRFLDEANFRKIISVLSSPQQLFLCWLAWDIGENINTLLLLQKRDFMREPSRDPTGFEYLVNLPKEKLKRSRTSRSEPIMHVDTSRYAEIVLKELQEDDLIFPFGHRQALKFLQHAARRSGAVVSPRSSLVRWKDFR